MKLTQETKWYRFFALWGGWELGDVTWEGAGTEPGGNRNGAGTAAGPHRDGSGPEPGRRQ